MLSEQDVMKMLEETQAVLHGHFLLTSGLHSPMYVEKFNVLQHPKYTEKLCQEIARRYADAKIELVVGPTTGGILLAHETGKALNTRAIFTERENGKMTLKRGFQIPAGTRVLVVEDIVTTGGSVREVMDVVREHGGQVIGVGLLVDRSGGKVDFGVRTEALLHLNVPTYKPADCPLCKEGKPLTKRGSTGKNNPVKK
jgi:orotate phosphoribosyltransferase